MILYKPAAGYGDLDEAIAECRALLGLLEDAEARGLLLADYPALQVPQCRRRASPAVQIEILTGEGHFGLFAKQVAK